MNRQSLAVSILPENWLSIDANPIHHRQVTAVYQGNASPSATSMPHKVTFAFKYFSLFKRYRNVRSVAWMKACLRLHSASSAPPFADLATRATSKHQIYISRSADPYLNLSIEHFLLQKTPIDSTVLFLYVNRPCVVIGRNQNPWLEVRLRHLRAAPCSLESWNQDEAAASLNLKEVALVRRRSGGGTVFHDEGNVNYSVICPIADFNRDKHAEMVVRAIRQHNDRARVNERHDIVLDQAPMRSKEHLPDANDMHITPYTWAASNLSPLKVSGSAYKLTRLRSLHHGTCLLASPHLSIISDYLRSPAAPFLKARGVESVRSPVGNIYTNSEASQNLIRTFQRGVIEAYANLYSLEKEAVTAFIDTHGETCLRHNTASVTGYIDDSMSKVPEINRGITELRVRKTLRYKFDIPCSPI